MQRLAVMSAYAPIAAKLDAGRRVLIDGGTGTELERLGAPMAEGAWIGDVVRTHPHLLRHVHTSHLVAGAEVIITNTFNSSKHLLEQAGLGQNFELSNRRAVEVAIEARSEAGSSAAIAGSMSVSRHYFDFPPVEVARDNYRVQAAMLAEAGVDFFILEMMRDIEQTRACAEGALATGLPVWCGWSCEGVDGTGEPMLYERNVSLRAALDATADLKFDATIIMHTEVDEVDNCLDLLDSFAKKPVGVYAHSGRFEHPNWVFNDVISIDDYATAVHGWAERGVQILGGCCGIACDHIAALNRML